MALVGKDTLLADIIIKEPSVLTVFNRFGITLGVGDNTIESICMANNIDLDLSLTILNTYINPGYFPNEIIGRLSLHGLLDYLEKTNIYYSAFQIPNIERHFNSLISRGKSGKGNLELMYGLFREVKAELEERINSDQEWFSEITRMYEAKDIENTSLNRLADKSEQSDSIEDKFGDLINMFVIHLKGEYDLNLCHAVLVALITIQKDITQNNRIRNRILKPIWNAVSNN